MVLMKRQLKKPKARVSLSVIPVKARRFRGVTARHVCKTLGFFVKSRGSGFDVSSIFSSSRRKPGSIFETGKIKVDPGFRRDDESIDAFAISYESRTIVDLHFLEFASMAADCLGSNARPSGRGQSEARGRS
jgi:hypothetical protein